MRRGVFTLFTIFITPVAFVILSGKLPAEARPTRALVRFDFISFAFRTGSGLADAFLAARVALGTGGCLSLEVVSRGAVGKALVVVEYGVTRRAGSAGRGVGAGETG